jgi:hypothetical protein
MRPNKSIPEPWLSVLRELDSAVHEEVRLDCIEDLSSPWCMVFRGQQETWTCCKSHRGMLADLCWNSVCRASGINWRTQVR